MIHLFKLCGQRIVYDTNSRKAHKLSPLAFKIIGSVTPPLKKGCPSPLRYAFAKYDSGDLSAAYDEIYGLYESGELFADEPSPEAEPSLEVVPYSSVIAGGKTKIVTVSLKSDDIENAVSLVAASSNMLLAPTADYSDASCIDAAVRLCEKLGACRICPIHEVKSGDESISETVLALRARGFTNISVLITQDAASASDNIISEYEQILKAIVRSEDKEFVFFPFIPDYISATNPGNGVGCSGCFAYGICHGAHSSAECDIIRKQTECALAYTAE